MMTLDDVCEAIEILENDFNSNESLSDFIKMIKEYGHYREQLGQYYVHNSTGWEYEFEEFNG